ncbi:unnamed protein product, partial [Sphacelaria rigidula]
VNTFSNERSVLSRSASAVGPLYVLQEGGVNCCTKRGGSRTRYAQDALLCPHFREVEPRLEDHTSLLNVDMTTTVSSFERPRVNILSCGLTTFSCENYSDSTNTHPMRAKGELS